MSKHFPFLFTVKARSWVKLVEFEHMYDGIHLSEYYEYGKSYFIVSSKNVLSEKDCFLVTIKATTSIMKDPRFACEILKYESLRFLKHPKNFDRELWEFTSRIQQQEVHNAEE